MKELSIFVDESGDFGVYTHFSQYYIVTMVIHEQSKSISKHVENLNSYLSNLQLGIHMVHSAQLIRKEGIYVDLSGDERYKIFSKFFHFTQRVGIKYKSIIVSKKHKKEQDLTNGISTQLSNFIKENLSYFQQFDKIIIYYDNGQKQLANVLISVFSSWFFDKFDYRRVSPCEYKLFQCADLICTLTMIEKKILDGIGFTKSELRFFNSYRDLRRNYLKHIKKFEL